MSDDGKAAQVVVGEGASRQSVTRHLRRECGRWIGRNPDGQAMELLDAYEAIAAAAEVSVGQLEAYVDGLGVVYAVFERHKTEVLPSKTAQEKAEQEFARLRKEAADYLALARCLAVAESKRAREQREKTPREVEFTF